MTNLLVSFLLLPISVQGFIHPPATRAARYECATLGAERYLSESSNVDIGAFETFEDETDETLLRINFSYENGDDSTALDAVRTYTKSFPFAAVLPVQPLTYLPVIFEGEMALKVTFLRKKTEEKDSKDGGLLFKCEKASNDLLDEDDGRQKINLVAKRISKGQTVSKIFSEKQIIMSFVKGLNEARGKDLLDSANVRVESIFHEWMST